MCALSEVQFCRALQAATPGQASSFLSFFFVWSTQWLCVRSLLPAGPPALFVILWVINQFAAAAQVYSGGSVGGAALMNDAKVDVCLNWAGAALSTHFMLTYYRHRTYERHGTRCDVAQVVRRWRRWQAHALYIRLQLLFLQATWGQHFFSRGLAWIYAATARRVVQLLLLWPSWCPKQVCCCQHVNLPGGLASDNTCYQGSSVAVCG